MMKFGWKERGGKSGIVHRAAKERALKSSRNGGKEKKKRRVHTAIMPVRTKIGGTRVSIHREDSKGNRIPAVEDSSIRREGCPEVGLGVFYGPRTKYITN